MISQHVASSRRMCILSVRQGKGSSTLLRRVEDHLSLVHWQQSSYHKDQRRAACVGQGQSRPHDPITKDSCVFTQLLFKFYFLRQTFLFLWTQLIFQNDWASVFLAALLHWSYPSITSDPSMYRALRCHAGTGMATRGKECELTWAGLQQIPELVLSLPPYSLQYTKESGHSHGLTTVESMWNEGLKRDTKLGAKWLVFCSYFFCNFWWITVSHLCHNTLWYDTLKR